MPNLFETCNNKNHMIHKNKQKLEVSFEEDRKIHVKKLERNDGCCLDDTFQLASKKCTNMAYSARVAKCQIFTQINSFQMNLPQGKAPKP